jgi:hypothetical protein
MLPTTPWRPLQGTTGWAIMVLALAVAGATCGPAYADAIPAFPYTEDFSTEPTSWANNSAVQAWQWHEGNQRIFLQSSTDSSSGYYLTQVQGVPSSTSSFESSIDVKMDVTGTGAAFRIILLADGISLNNPPTSFYMIGVDGWGSNPTLRIRHRPIGGSLAQISGNHGLGVSNLGTSDWYTLSVEAEWLAPGYDFTVTLTNKTTGNTVGTPLTYTHAFAAGSNNDLSGNEYFGIQTWVTLSGGSFLALADDFAVVPEPSSWMLLLPAGVGLAARRRRKNRQARGA